MDIAANILGWLNYYGFWIFIIIFFIVIKRNRKISHDYMKEMKTYQQEVLQVLKEIRDSVKKVNL